MTYAYQSYPGAQIRVVARRRMLRTPRARSGIDVERAADAEEAFGARHRARDVVGLQHGLLGVACSSGRLAAGLVTRRRADRRLNEEVFADEPTPADVTTGGERC